MSKTLPSLALLLAVVTGLSFAGQGQPTPKPAPRDMVLRGAGSTFSALLYKKWFSQYGKLRPDVLVTYDAVGSGAGIERFIGNGIDADKRVDFGASDAAMTDLEMAKVAKGARLIPMTAGGVVLAYNLPDVRGELRLSREAYTGIFLGKITNWADPIIQAANPDLVLPNMTITIVTRADSSGTTFAFTKHLDAISPEWRQKHGAATFVDFPGTAMRERGNERVAGFIKLANGSIGYVELGFAQKLGLKTARLENRDGRYVTASTESAMAAIASAELPDNLRVFIPDPAGADSYPIVTLSWILVYSGYDDPKKSIALKDLFGWCLREGQTYSSELGYVPLPMTISDRAAVALATITP